MSEQEKPAAEAKLVKVKVNEAGHLKIHDGKGGRYKEGDVVECSPEQAKSLKRQGFVG